MFLATSCLITQLVPAQLDWYQINCGSLHLSCGVQVQTNLVRSCCWVAEMGLLWYIDVGKGPRRNCMVLCTQTCAAITSKLRYRRCSVLYSHMYWHKLHKPSTLELKGLAAADGKLRISCAVLDPQWSTERSGFLHLETDRTRTCIFRKQLARPQCQGVQACMPEAPACYMVCFCSSPSWHLILFSAFTGEAHYWFRSIFDRTCLCPWGPQKYCSAKCLMFLLSWANKPGVEAEFCLVFGTSGIRTWGADFKWNKNARNKSFLYPVTLFRRWSYSLPWMNTGLWCV